MIRINKLLRTAKFLNKIPVRGGPGWDRPDVPSTQFVERDTKYTQLEIVYTIFDPSMPQFFLTQTEIYEGGLLNALPQFGSIWGFLVGTAFSIFVFHQLVNNTRKYALIEPVSTKFFLSQVKRINQDKQAFKQAKQNPFGINVFVQHYPHQNAGKYHYAQKYLLLKQSYDHIQLINSQAAQYLKSAILRAKNPISQAHHH